MSTIDDPLKLVTDLKPAQLDCLAEEGYSRRRHDDLARALDGEPGHGLRKRTLAVSAAAACVAAAVVAGILVSAPGEQHAASTHHGAAAPVIRLTAAQRVLYRLSADAATVPQPAGRYVELTETDSGPALGDAKNQQDLRNALAIMKKVPALRKVYLATLKELKETPSVLDTQRISVIDSLTGNTWTYQQGSGAPGELPEAKHGSPAKAQFAAWPTSVPALRALLLAQADQQVADHVQSTGQTSDDLVFEQASNWLWNPLISPGLRSALYKVLADTPGVVVKTGTTDHVGRPAIEISRYNSAAKDDLATFENPSTGAVLESLYDGNSSDVYQSITSSASLPANPFHT